MIIQNVSQLATTPLRKQALLIADAALEGIDTAKVFAGAVQYKRLGQLLRVQGHAFRLANYKRVIAVGIGDCAVSAIAQLQAMLGDGLHQSVVLDAQNAQEVTTLLEACSEDDLVLYAISKGEQADLYPNLLHQQLIEALVGAGCTESELQIVQNHMGIFSGGRVAALAYPATIIGLIFSNSQNLQNGVSALITPDATTVHDARAIVGKYKVLQKVGQDSFVLTETPKGPKYFEKVHTYILASPRDLLEAAKKKAADLGFEVRAVDTFDGILRKVTKGTCVVAVGKHAFSKAGPGLHGPNQDFALSVMSGIASGQVLVALASSGSDNTDAAGAVVDIETKQRAKKLLLSAKVYLDTNDSYHFFEGVGDAVMTGLTGSNAADIAIVLQE
jgi:glycerate 2-kinase